MSNVPLPRPGPLGLIQYAGVDMLQYAGAVSAADNAALRKRVRELTTQAMFDTSTIERLRAEVAGLREDAERYHEWKRAFREGECALWNALCECQSDAEHDAAIDAALAACFAPWWSKIPA